MCRLLILPRYRFDRHCLRSKILRKKTCDVMNTCQVTLSMQTKYSFKVHISILRVHIPFTPSYLHIWNYDVEHCHCSFVLDTSVSISRLCDVAKKYSHYMKEFEKYEFEKVSLA